MASCQTHASYLPQVSDCLGHLVRHLLSSRSRALGSRQESYAGQGLRGGCLVAGRLSAGDGSKLE
jgi:hypothetical protein